MKNKLFYSLLVLVSLFECFVSKTFAQQDVLNYVNPLIGSGGHGHVFVGASVPHGMVQLGPNNLSKGWDWCSGYHDSDSTIIGFAHTHLSGTGIADLGDILFMPIVQESVYVPDPLKPYFSRFKKKNEKVSPGYYKVLLDTSNVNVELTSSTRVGYQRYLFPKTSKTNQVLIDLVEGVKSLESRKGVLEGCIKIINDSTIVGYRYSDEWALNHQVYFYSVFSKKIDLFQVYESGELVNTKSYKGHNVQAVLTFDGNFDTLEVKTAISYVSIEGAKLNYEKEASYNEFNSALNKAKKQWKEKLSTIEINSKDNDLKTKFYTALYHTAISPSVFSDVEGNYRGADNRIYQENNFETYSVFSFWDTYRAFHPLMTLIDTSVSSYANSIMNINSQQKRMPVWHLVGSETDCMTGVHSIPVLVDAVLKGLYDKPEKVLQDISEYSDYNYAGLPLIKEYGYIPADKEMWSVAKGLEYAIDDYAIAQLALKLKNEDLYKKHLSRSKSYTKYFDKNTGFMRGVLSDGSYRVPFDPSHSIHLEDDYIEGNAWQYTWLVPHDVEGLVGLFGSKERFISKLDSLFKVDSKLNEGASVDITGMIGQYAHGNEPSHHIAYMYGYVGEPWKTADLIRKIDKNFYTTAVDGLIGNEDCGQMSSWYIFSSLGFYPVNPNNGAFVFGSPLVDYARINLNNWKVFEIEVVNNSDENKYIKSIIYNNEKLNQLFITYDQIMKGGKLIIHMSDKPNYSLSAKQKSFANSKQTLF